MHRTRDTGGCRAALRGRRRVYRLYCGECLLWPDRVCGRVAVFSAIAAGQRDFVAMAIVADGDSMPYPCGACRQVLAEFCREEFSVFIAKASALDDYDVVRLAVLLPNRFRLSN